MDIREYRIKDLLEFTNSDEYKRLMTVPVTPHRALSQAKNPRAGENDLALVVAYDQGEPVGYVGAVPDYMFAGNEEFKMAWGSTGWVHPDYKNTGIYVVLLFRAMEFYHNNFALAEVSESAEKVFIKSKKFIQLKNLVSKTIVCRSCMTQVLINRNRKFKLLFPFFKAADFLFNALMYPVFSYRIKSSGITKKISAVEIHEFDEESTAFIKKYQEKNLFQRGKEEFDWILQYPWVTESPRKSTEDKKYFFSSSSPLFRLNAFKLYENNNLIAIIILKQRDNHISVPYAFYNESTAKNILQYLFYVLFKNKADKITVFNDDLINELNKVKIVKLYVKTRERKSYITKKFDTLDFNEYSIQSGDGDVVFT